MLYLLVMARTDTLLISVSDLFIQCVVLYLLAETRPDTLLISISDGVGCSANSVYLSSQKPAQDCRCCPFLLAQSASERSLYGMLLSQEEGAAVMALSGLL